MMEIRMPKETDEGTGRRATMTDVAKRAGVSQSTVSLVLNGTPGMRLSEPTRQRVLEVAAELGYRLPGGRPHAVAPRRGAAAPSSAQAAALIVYLVDEISTSPHPVVSIDGAKDEAWAHGAVVAVFAARSNAEIESAVLATMLASPSLVGVIYSAVFTRQTRVPPLLHKVPLLRAGCRGRRRARRHRPCASGRDHRAAALQQHRAGRSGGRPRRHRAAD
jgi:LacI family transcriptional regulator